MEDEKFLHFVKQVTPVSKPINLALKKKEK